VRWWRAAVVGLATPVQAHHSFAIFDAEQTKVFTGVVTRVNPDANHLQIFFAPMNEERKNVERGPDGKPVIWAVEMEGLGAGRDDGYLGELVPARHGLQRRAASAAQRRARGSRRDTGAIYKCPEKTPPAPGKELRLGRRSHDHRYRSRCRSRRWRSKPWSDSWFVTSRRGSRPRALA
jgi:hypothetical protein